MIKLTKKRSVDASESTDTNDAFTNNSTTNQYQNGSTMPSSSSLDELSKGLKRVKINGQTPGEICLQKEVIRLDCATDQFSVEKTLNHSTVLIHVFCNKPYSLQPLQPNNNQFIIRIKHTFRITVSTEK